MRKKKTHKNSESLKSKSTKSTSVPGFRSWDLPSDQRPTPIKELQYLEEILPKTSVIKTKGMAWLYQYHIEFEQIVSDNRYDLSEIDQIVNAPKIKSLLKVYNKKVFQVCRNSSFLKREAKAHQEVFKWEVNGEWITLELDLKLTLGGLKHVLKIYSENEISRWKNVIELNDKGRPSRIVIWATQDRDYFFDYVAPKIEKQRKTGSPNLSATAVKLGTEVKGSDDEVYRAVKFKKSQRWAKVS